MEKNPIQDQSRMFACSDGYLMGGSNKVNNRNRERVGREEGLTTRCGANYLPQRLAKSLPYKMYQKMPK